MIYSKQKFYCNACGKECFIEATAMLGRHWRVCSIECIREAQWRETLSIMGVEYYPNPKVKL